MATKKPTSESRKMVHKIEKKRDLSPRDIRERPSQLAVANALMREEELDDQPIADGPSIVTHLPDVVVFTNHKRLLPNQQTVQGVVLFLDISGFTALCEKYSLAGKTGTDQLTKTLNGYMNALVSEIVSYDGDILKFAGDAILTLWQVDNFVTMQATVGHVIQCALDVQLKNGEYMTSVGVVLKVKIGIAAGEISILCIGNNEQRSYVEMGRAVDAVNKAEHFCKKGDVVVSPTAWCHCYKLVTEHLVLSDGKHVKVNALLANNGPQYVMRRTIHVTESMLNLDMSVANLRLPGWVFENPSLASPNVPSPEYKPPTKAASKGNPSPTPAALKDLPRNVVSPKATVETVAETSSSIRRLRKAVISRFEHDTIERLKLYVAQPVLKKLDEGQPLDYLSEMRQVTILFINLIIDRSTKVEYACTMQACFDLIFDNCKKSQGSVSKIFLFDKGCTFIVIFGLPGFKHENDCAHALICAKCIDREMVSIKKVSTTSIGVTTGPTYCGVVGHYHRHEYTVIGRKVNMAARLMMYYPGKVTCDNETYYHSKLSKGNFIAQELKEMKGLQNVGTIRCFKPKNNVKETIDVLIAEEQQRPIIGRDAELQLYQKELGYFLSQTPETHHRQLIVINGEPGMGKTRMLDSFVARALKKKIRVVSIVLTLHDSHTPYNAVTMLLIQLFEFDLDSEIEERESYLQSTFSSVPFIMENLCLFNSLLNVRFTMDLNNCRLNDEDRMNKIEEMLLLMLRILTADIGHIIFAIDDAHLMDIESWKFMPAFGHYKLTMLILTLRNPWINKNPTAESLLSISATLPIQMGPLNPQYLAALACQLLNVTMIPRKLDKMLRQKSMGVPSWVELLLREYMFEGVIRVEPLSDYQSEAMVSPAPKWVRDRKFPRADAFIERGIETEAVEHTANTGHTFLDRLVKETSVNAQMICAFVPDKQIEIGVPGSIKGMIQAKIDKMEEIDQMFIKTASILRDKFPRKMFESIIQTPTEADRIGDSLQRLADQGIFACYTKESAVMNSTYAVNQKKALGMTGILATCMCVRKDGSKEEKPMRDCQFITFQSTSFQETAYEMLLENNRRPLHLAAAQFLESQVKKCLEGRQPCNQGQLMARFFFDDDEPETAVAHVEPMEPIYSEIELEHFEPVDALEEHALVDSPSRSSSKLSIPSESTGDRTSQKDSTSTLQVPVGAARRAQAKRPRFELESIAQVRKSRKTTAVAKEKARLHTIISPVIPIKDRRMTIERNLFSYKVQSIPTVLESGWTSYVPTALARKRISSIINPLGWTIKRLIPSGSAPSMLPTLFPASAIPEQRDVSKNVQGDAMIHMNMDAWEKMRVLSFIYPQIVDQYRRSGNIQNTVYYLTEAAAACINLCDHQTAYDYLVEVRSIFKALKIGKNPFEGIVSSMDTWMFSDFQEAQVERLSGVALYHVGETKKAILHFRRALALLNSPIPRNRLKIQWRVLHAMFTQYKHHLWPTKYQGKASAADALRLSEQAKCLYFIFLDSSIRKRNTLARYAALEQVNKAEQAGDDICALIDAYTCVLQISETMSLDKISESYEDKAKVRCVVSMQDVRPDNLLTLTQMLWASFSARISHTGYLSAIQSGNMASQLMSHIRVSQTLSQMLPILVESYMAVNRLHDATEVLGKLKVNVSKEDPLDFIMICWYYCCCMDLILYGGIRLEDTKECILFAKEATTKSLFNDYPLPLFCLACTICVWYQRVENAGKLCDWMEIASDYEPKKFDNFLSVSAFLKLTECKLVELSRLRGLAAPNSSTVVHIKDRRASIKRDLNYIQKKMTQLLVLKPRVFHLKAYLAVIYGHRSRSRSLLEDCISLGVMVDNMLECQWAARNHFHWFGTQSPTFVLCFPVGAQTQDEETDRDHWKENVTKSFPFWSDHAGDSGGKAFKYPLPLPDNSFDKRFIIKAAAVHTIQSKIERTSDASTAKQPLLESIPEPSDIVDESQDP